jgi:hypothetical protein
MSTLFAGLIVISGVTLVIGCFTWRSGGRNLPLVSGAIAAGAASMLVDESRLQIVLASALVILLLTSVLTIIPDIWRTLRTELLIAGTASMAMVAASLANDSLTKRALLALVSVSVMAFLLMLGRRALGTLRVATRPR